MDIVSVELGKKKKYESLEGTTVRMWRDERSQETTFDHRFRFIRASGADVTSWVFIGQTLHFFNSVFLMNSVLVSDINTKYILNTQA